MSSNSSVAFGSGALFATPSGVNQTPIQFGTLQDVSIDYTSTLKELVGQSQVAVAVARGVMKIMGKAKFANIDGNLMANLFFNNTTTTGQKLTSLNEAATIPTTPFIVTVANGATFDANFGVISAATGLPLTLVASAPITGQYALNAVTGAYTYAAADTGKIVLTSYAYTQSILGKKAVFANPTMGVAPTFQIDFYQQNPNVTNAQWSYRLYSCISSKLTLASKLEDFMVPEMDFQAFANTANNVHEMNTAA